MGDRHCRLLVQSLINDTIALRKTNKRTQLFFRCVGLQVEGKPDALKPNRHILRDTQGATKIEIAFSSHDAASNCDAYRRRDGIERHTSASNKRLEQHITGACA